jgi:cell division protein FtsL
MPRSGSDVPRRVSQVVVTTEDGSDRGETLRSSARAKAATLSGYLRLDVANRRGVGVWAFALALLTAAALAHVAVRMHGIQIAYDLGREKRVNSELQERQRSLIIEIGMLKDPGRVIGLAHDKMQMGPPAATNVIKLEPGVVLP